MRGMERGIGLEKCPYRGILTGSVGRAWDSKSQGLEFKPHVGSRA